MRINKPSKETKTMHTTGDSETRLNSSRVQSFTDVHNPNNESMFKRI